MKSVFIYISLASTLLFSCGPKEVKENDQKYIDANELKKQLEEVQQPSIKMENDNIDSYIKQHQLQMQTTGSGLRYAIVKENVKGKQLVSMDEITVKYKVSLLDGTLCYTSEKTGPKKIKIDMDNVESGLHQGLKLMKVGEKAIFILPSHLAHGLTGDNNLIPPKASVFYEIEVTEKNN
jgi:FKBP-type peptidyl-prolyl cis-trans isomerase FkpA